MSDYGLSVRNQLGDVVIDSKYRNMALLHEQPLNVTTTNTHSISFSRVTSDAPPVVALRRWTNPELFFSTVVYEGSPGNWTGVTLYFYGLNSHTSDTVWVRLYAYDLPAKPGYGMRINNDKGQLVFDSARLPLTFIKELKGRREDWEWTWGTGLSGVARRDFYKPSVWDSSINDYYLAVGLALDLELGHVQSGGAVFRVLVDIRWGFSAQGWPVLWQEASAYVNGPSIPGAVYYSMPSIPIIRA